MIPLPIETERLVIRAWDDADLPVLETIFTDEEVMRYIPVRDPSIAAMVERYRRTHDERGYSFWAVWGEERILGEVGFGYNERESCPELGWLLARDAWGHGYATESARAAVDALFTATDHERVVALVDTRNERSLRTADRIGLRSLGVVDELPQPHVLFEVTRT